jgi:cytochrome c
MDLLNSAALPQSTEHVHLLLFIMNVVFVVFLPYLAFLLGSGWFALVYDLRGRAARNPLHVRFARDLTNTAVFSKRGLAFLVVLPSASLVFLYAQLLQGTPAIAVGLMVFASAALLAGVILLAAFRYTFALDGILGERAAGSQAAELDIAAYVRQNERVHLRMGAWGMSALTLGAVLTVGASTIAADPHLWSRIDSFFMLLLSASFWIRLFQFSALTLCATGVGVLFFFLSWQGGVRNAGGEYGELIRKFGFRISLIALLTLPVFVLASVALMPPEALSGTLFALVGLGLAFLFLSAQFLYAFKRDGATRYTAYAFFALALALTLLSTTDQLAIGNATKMQAARLAVSYERDLDALKAKLGIALKMLSGQEIYDAKCSACHLFDQKKVGPPYNIVVKKYAGRKAQLMQFVLNPVKVDPAYPNMPNQGLRPAEADSIATFLMHKVLGTKDAPAAATTEGAKK